MTILTYDFSNSYRGVTHTQKYYEGLAPQLFATSAGYNDQPLAHYVQTAILHHPDNTTETIDDRDAFHPEKTVADSLNIPVALVLANSPTSHHYDLWQHYPGNPNEMSLRVSGHVPPPPNWSDYIKTDYYGNDQTDSGYGADLQKYLTALFKWEAGDGWLTSNGVDIPRTDATLREGNNTLGSIHASNALDPNSFLDIADLQAVVKGSQFDDAIDGGKFGDKLYGNDGKDSLTGFAGNDTLSGGSGNDALDGGLGSDGLQGGSGADHLVGDVGNDKLEGGSGDDKLDGDGGIDTLRGQSGNDRLDGGKGSDNLLGGAGKDQFVFTNHDDMDEILDFQHDADKIVLSKSAFEAIDKMNADAFHEGPQAADAQDRIIYWHNVLYYDADGNKDGDHGFQQVAFAKIENDATLSFSDFLLE